MFLTLDTMRLKGEQRFSVSKEAAPVLRQPLVLKWLFCK